MLSGDDPFEAEAERYDAWFDRHPAAYVSELLALRAFVPWQGAGLELGVGTGRFAAPLGVCTGVDPSPAMLAQARARGVEGVAGYGEALPWPDAAFDHVLMVTTLCFLHDPHTALGEARRVLKPGGRLTAGLVDRATPLGERYEARRGESPFYVHARFFSATEAEALLAEAGFQIDGRGQTLVRAPGGGGEAIEPLRPGTGEGGFAVLSALVA